MPHFPTVNHPFHFSTLSRYNQTAGPPSRDQQVPQTSADSSVTIGPFF